MIYTDIIGSDWLFKVCPHTCHSYCISGKERNILILCLHMQIKFHPEKKIEDRKQTEIQCLIKIGFNSLFIMSG